jgi:hypothetical protein
LSSPEEETGIETRLKEDFLYMHNSYEYPQQGPKENSLKKLGSLVRVNKHLGNQLPILYMTCKDWYIQSSLGSLRQLANPVEKSWLHYWDSWGWGTWMSYPNFVLHVQF